MECKVHHIRFITESVFVLRFDRNELAFRSGQHILAGIHGKNDQREYSIYSGEEDDFFEILVKIVEKPSVSLALSQLKSGDLLEIEKPMGFFGIPKDALDKKFLFIANGTGIAPFHSFIRSYPALDYQIIHGIRYMNEAYDQEVYAKGRYISCVTNDSNGHYQGRVTEYLKQYPLLENRLVYLCGNSQMINDVKTILTQQGFNPAQMFNEIYF